MRALFPLTRSPIRNVTRHAARQFAVDREIEQCSISDPLVLIEKEAESPNVAGFQRPFWTDFLAGVPGAPFMHGRVKA